MKKHFYFIIPLALLIVSCQGQNISKDKVPSLVLNALKSNFPLANKVDWEKHGNLYEAELDLNDTTEVSLRIDDAGKLIMKKQDISKIELPTGVMNTIKSQYNTYEIDDVEKIQKNDSVYFQVELKAKGKRELNLVFSANGNEEKEITYWD